MRHAHSVNAALIAATLWLSAGPMARGEVVSQTGFESPAFTAGPLAGQDGWTTVGGNAVSVSTLRPQTGSQAVLIDGAGLVHSADYPAVLIGADARRVFDITPIASGTPIVSLQASVRLDGPNTNTGGGINDDLISANLDVYDENGAPVTEMLLSSNGNVYASAWGNPYSFATPVTLGEYHTMGIRLNYLTRTSDYFLDGQLLGTLPFGAEVQSHGVRGPGLMVFAFDDPIINPALYTASFDNFSIGAEVPEPAGLALFGLLATGCLFARRRR